MKKVAAAFQALGIVIAVLVVILLTVATMYISYVLAIGVFIGLSIFITYKLLRLREKLEDTP